MHCLKMGGRITKAFFKALDSKEAVKCIEAFKTIKGRAIDYVDIKREFVNHYKMVFQVKGMKEKMKVTM